MFIYDEIISFFRLQNIFKNFYVPWRKLCNNFMSSDKIIRLLNAFSHNVDVLFIQQEIKGN